MSVFMMTVAQRLVMTSAPSLLRWKSTPCCERRGEGSVPVRDLACSATALAGPGAAVGLRGGMPCEGAWRARCPTSHSRRGTIGPRHMGTGGPGARSTRAQAPGARPGGASGLPLLGNRGHRGRLELDAAGTYLGFSRRRRIVSRALARSA